MISREMLAALIVTGAVCAAIFYVGDSTDAPQARSGIASSERAMAAAPARRMLSPQSMPAGSEAQQDTSAGTIVKCSMAGKTTYSNRECEAGHTGVRVNVALTETAGVVSPSRELVQETMARSEYARKMEVLQFSEIAKVAAIGRPQDLRLECDALQQRIAHLESMARMPQSAQTQDWITREKRIAIDRQNTLRC